MIHPSGPILADFAIVGEGPGYDEERLGQPFVGTSGQELNRMLGEAGILRSECFCTNVLNERHTGDVEDLVERGKKCPPGFLAYRGVWAAPKLVAAAKRLDAELAIAQPKIIIAVGNIALFVLTGHWGIKSWRGSRLVCANTRPGGWLVPTYNPSAVLRQWSIRAQVVQDLRRAADLRIGTQVPAVGDFAIPGSPSEAILILEKQLERALLAPIYLSVDIETRAQQIACTGIAWSETSAVCIPSMISHAPYWWCSEAEEALIVLKMRELLTHPNVRVIGQNFLYDAQYFIRRWKFLPNIWFDTMIGHHATFNTLPKGLDFLSAMYAKDHVYWKDESKDWDPAVGEMQLWLYNCKDAVITYEVAFEIIQTATSLGTLDNVEFQHSLFLPALYAMHTGVPIDGTKRAKFGGKLVEEMVNRQREIDQIVGHPLSPRSPKQLATFFYSDLKLPPVKNRKTGAVTTNREALEILERKEPLVIPITSRIEALRSLGVFNSTFVCAALDRDGRMRCSFNVAGTTTYRWSSSSNAWGTGTNLQNLPKGSKLSKDDLAYVELPNIRELFIPPTGYTFFDVDLDRADLQVVVWEADDAELLSALQLGVDMHIFNASTLFDFVVPVEELVESHANYPEHKAKWKRERQLAKMWVHGTNYGGGARTMAIAAGVTVHKAEQLRAKWFSAHPGIKRWHERTERMIAAGCVSNIFGAKWYIFDRSDNILPEALAWQPQSVVSRVINTLNIRIFAEEPNIHVPLQVHDSLAGFFPTHLKSPMLDRITALSKNIVPYDKPLIIPTGIKTSTISWGACGEENT
jgi:uracil-DNA glycosylase family 4